MIYKLCELLEYV